MAMTETPTPFPIGQKIRRLRELKGMKQETLAFEIGTSRQNMSKIEQSDTIEKETLEKISSALGVSVDAIKKYNDDAIVSNINSFYDNSALNFQCTFNPFDKIVQLYDEKIVLLERMLQSEKEKWEKFEALVNKNKPTS